MSDAMPVKTLGPFTGRQLTTVIVAIVVMVMLPVGAMAVTGSNVFVTDATSGARAKVDTAGNVQSKVSGGSVVAPPAAPNAMIRGGAVIASNGVKSPVMAA